MTVRARVAGVGLRGPGLDGWARSRPVLAGTEPWADAPVLAPPPALLAANERRRAGMPVRLALAVAEEAVRMAGLPPDAVRGVFGSANGEGAILHDLLQTLASADPAVSPTQFHNSVHNAVAGYWAMAASSRQPMTSLGASVDTFAATLLKALAEVQAERAPVLLCAYDAPMPEPLDACQPTGCAFAVALVLLPGDADGALATLEAAWHPEPPAGAPDPADALAALARRNPAARALRLLRAVARGDADRFGLPLLGGALTVEVRPCSTATPSRA